MTYLAKIEWFDRAKGFGIARSVGMGEIFLHIKNNVYDNFKEGDIALIKTVRTERGKLSGFDAQPCLIDKTFDFESVDILDILRYSSQITNLEWYADKIATIYFEKYSNSEHIELINRISEHCNSEISQRIRFLA
jgi:cold shock CspA family protein